MSRKTIKSEQVLGCMVWLFIIFFMFLGTLGWYQNREAVLIGNVKKYCSEEQIIKTGELSCISAQKRLKDRIKDYRDSLKKDQEKTPGLTKEKESKCSKKGLRKYGTEGCSAASGNLEKNLNSVNKLTRQINALEQEIKPLKSEISPEKETSPEEETNLTENDFPEKKASSLGLRKQLADN